MPQYTGTVGSITGIYTRPSFSGIAIGDLVEADWVASTGEFDPVDGQVYADSVAILRIRVFDQTDGVWGNWGEIVIPSGSTQPGLNINLFQNRALPNERCDSRHVDGDYLPALQTLAPEVYIQSSRGTPMEDLYCYDAKLLKLNDYQFLSTYYKGGSHTSNDGRIFGRIIDHNGETIIDEFLLADDPRNFDTRGNITYRMSNGRILFFYSVYDPDALQRYGLWLRYSDLGGLPGTWSTPVNIEPDIDPAEPGHAPFGQILETSQGLIGVFYYYTFGMVIARSDDGVNWEQLNLIPWPEGELFSEAQPVRVDNDRIVIVIRDDGNDNTYRHLKSSDGGATWTGFSQPYEYVSTVTAAGSPCIIQGITQNDQVFATFAARNPVGELYGAFLDREAFWTNPQNLWAESNPTRRLLYSAIESNATVDFSAFGSVERSDGSQLLVFQDDDSENSLLQNGTNVLMMTTEGQP